MVLLVYLEHVLQSALGQMWSEREGEESYAADSEIPSPVQIVPGMMCKCLLTCSSDKQLWRYVHVAAECYGELSDILCNQDGLNNTSCKQRSEAEIVLSTLCNRGIPQAYQMLHCSGLTGSIQTAGQFAGHLAMAP